MDVMWLGGREVNAPVRRAHVQRSVCAAARSVGLDREAVEQLRLEAAERLERDDYGDIMNRPLREILAEIHRDLGLKPDWEPRDQELWFRQEVGSGARRRPFTAPIAPATAGGGEPGAGRRFGQHANARSSLRAGAAEERGVEGASGGRYATASPVSDSS